jgi:hypothetical protein
MSVDPCTEIWKIGQLVLESDLDDVRISLFYNSQIEIVATEMQVHANAFDSFTTMNNDTLSASVIVDTSSVTKAYIYKILRRKTQ